MDVPDKIDAAAYKAADKLERLAETFGDKVATTDDRLTERFGDAADRFADKIQQVTHQGPYDTRDGSADREGGDRPFMDKVNDALDTLADKLPIGPPDPSRDSGRR